MAWSNDFFQFDYKSNPRQWCRNCHIPLRAQQASTKDAIALRNEGITCVTCHVRGDTFFATRKRPRSPHNTVALAQFGNDRFCAGCHQFNFPAFGEHGELERYTDEPMQDTVEQFRKGPFASSKTCRDCHAQSPGGHTYPGGHDLRMLKKALQFEVCLKGDLVQTRLSNVGAGHNVPTGDVHRHIVIKAWKSNAPEKLVEAFYGRRFKPLVGGGKETIWNSSLPPSTYRDWNIDPSILGGGIDEAINIEVRYLYGSRETYRPPFREAPHSTVFRIRTAASTLPPCSG